MKNLIGMLLVMGGLNLATTFSAFAEDKTPLTILNLQLANPVVSGGERLDLRVTAYDKESGLLLNGGTGIYLGFIVQNVFINSDALNRSLEPAGQGFYQVKDLVVNPWVVPNRQIYTIQEFYLFDRAGNRASLQAREDWEYYNDQHGAPTNIKVVRFSVRPNPNGDTVGPQIQSLMPMKDTFSPGEELVLKFTAWDNVSGVHVGCCAGTLTTPNIFAGSAGVNGVVSPLGRGAYRVTGLKIDPNTPDGRAVIFNLSIQDRAGNWGALRLRDANQEFYANEQRNESTNVRAVWITIKRTRHK